MKKTLIILTSFVLGVVVGVGGMMAYPMLGSADNAKQVEEAKKTTERLSLYDQIEEDPNGNFYITSSTRTYHRRTCSWLDNATRIKRISYNDVVVYNITPCSKCQ